MKQVFNAMDVLFIDVQSNTVVVNMGNPIQTVHSNLTPEIDKDFADESISEVILKFVKQKYGMKVSWEDVVRATLGEMVIIYPLYLEAKEYLRNEMIQELVYSLPNKEILDVADRLVVKGKNGKLIILKSRDGKRGLTEESEHGYVTYEKREQKLSDCRKFLGCNVIVDYKVLHKRGQDILDEF
ncbi:hypothetical protein ACQKIY_25490 [Bacillus mycoides]|uniref:hypothetical protein n=1 Tax=Bacillus mycoides TaxID=1405 RepID=UPI003D0574E4